jgi:hypothetical protein
MYSVVPVSSSLLTITPDKSEIMAFLGQDPLRCKIFVGNKCLRKVEKFKYLGFNFPIKIKRVFEKN